MQRQTIKGNKFEWKLTIGLEIHAQVRTKTKLFSRSSTSFGAAPNEHVSFIDAALPGTLPTLNAQALNFAVKTGLGIEGNINPTSIFDRKNYFYADLPQGYQISQFSDPIVSGGQIRIIDEYKEERVIGIERIHLEQDAGKSLHDQSPTESYIDLNRCGIPLMEIVTKPDLRSSFEAGEFVKKLRTILRYLNTCDGDMEKGSLRCDANVSVNRIDDEVLGTRAEIKNLNSIKNIVKAINFEAQRQIECLESGGVVQQETRLFDAATGTTRSMRTKENSHDYRYFADPDLLPVELETGLIEEMKRNLPELPDQKKERFIKELGLSSYDANALTADKEVADFYEQAIVSCDPKLAANWLLVELFARLNKENQNLESSKITPSLLAQLVNLITDGTISGKIAKGVFDDMFESGTPPAEIVETKGLRQVTNTVEIIGIINDILATNRDKVEEYRSGKVKLFGYFVGEAMKQTKGQANPGLVNQILKEQLDKA